MGITTERFQTVVLNKPIDLEAQLYTKSLDENPKTVWQSILLWLNQLLKLSDRDQFDSIQVAQNIENVVQELDKDPEFFEKLDLAQVEQAIDNLEALKSKFATNPSKKDDVERILNRPIRTLKFSQEKKKTQELILEHKRSLEEKRALEQKFKKFVESQETNDAFILELQNPDNKAFEMERRHLTTAHEDCSYLGIDNLRKVYLQDPKAAEQNPAQLFKIAKIRKARTANFNKDRLSEINAYFKDSKSVLVLLFPAHAGKPDELNKMLKEGTITFEHAHITLLSQAIRNPVEAKESAERAARTYENNPLFNETPEEKEHKRILGELVLLRNDTPVKLEPTTLQQLVPKPVVVVPEPVELPAPAVEPTPVEEFKEQAVQLMEKAVDMGGDLTEKAVQVSEDVANKAYEVGKEIFDRAANATEGLGDTALVGRVRDTGGEFMEKAVEVTGNLGGIAYEKSGELLGAAAKVTGDLGNIAYEQGGKLAGVAAETAVKGLSSAASYLGKGATTALFNGVKNQVFWAK